jgi:hypothetical protein
MNQTFAQLLNNLDPRSPADCGGGGRRSPADCGGGGRRSPADCGGGGR